jgi:hypothetical protein
MAPAPATPCVRLVLTATITMHFTQGRGEAERAFAASELAGRTQWLRSGETAVIV